MKKIFHKIYSSFLLNKIKGSIIFVLFVVLISAFSFIRIYRITLNNCWDSLAESAVLADSRMISVIENYYATLQYIDELISTKDSLENQQLAKQIQDIKLRFSEETVRLYLPNGYAVTDKKIYKDASNFVKYNQIQKDRIYFTPVKKDVFDNEKYVIEYFYPLKKNDKIIGMLSVVTDVKKLEQFVIKSSEKSNTEIQLYDKNSNMIYVNTGKNKMTSLKEYEKSKIKSRYSLKKFISDINKRIPSRMVLITPEKETLYMFSFPSVQEELSVISIMNENVFYSKIEKLRHTYLFLTVMVFAGFFIYLMWLLNDVQNQIKKESLEYSEIAIALSNSYEGIYYVNLVDNSYAQFNMRGGIKNAKLKLTGKDFFEDCLHNSQRIAFHGDLDLLQQIVSKENLLKEIKKGPYVSPAYKLKIAGKIIYYRIKAIASTSDSNYMIIATENVDQEMKKDYEKQLVLERALEKAETANKVKSTFLRNISHDIRTPMNAIVGYTNIALTELMRGDNKKVQDYLSKVSISSSHLLSLINDILDMSRIESGKFKISENIENLREITSELKTMVSTEVDSKQHSFIINNKKIKDELVYCDKVRINQILLNIVTNSIKYTPEGGKIVLDVIQKEMVSGDYCNYEFRIKDNGIGMSETFLQTIFEPFTRERDSTISGIQGTGLGMAITRNLIEMVGGSIKINSQKGIGTEIIVQVPFKIVAESKLIPDNNPVKDENINLTGMKILLVEDNAFNREIAHVILQNEGCIVEEAEDGKIAVDIISKSKPKDFDLILMDLQMPIMNGYEATKKIRSLKDKELSEIPIIAMTANAFEEDKRISLEIGMNNHLSKPIDIDKLKQALAEFF